MKLVLGPLLRHAGTDEATVWVQTSEPGTVEVRPEGRRAATERTFTVEGHHYALIHVTELPPDTATPYEVALDGEVVWPEPESRFPPSVLRTHTPHDPVRIVFGSCRVAAPHEPPHTLRKDEHPDGREVDALRGLALRMAKTPAEEWPHALLLLGDQVYADEVHPGLEGHLDGGDMVVSYDDYVQLYVAAWGEPVIRWLLSTIPSAMIFDDHDVHDDWNTSIEWVTEMRQKAWWRKRIVSAFESYLIYQHLGNLSPVERAEFELYEHLRTAEDPTPRLRAFAKQADEEVEGTRWSFCRDIGPARVVMIDSRAGRVLDPGKRSMVDPDEWRWIEEHATGGVDHLLLGTSLPMFMGPALHWLEAWNEVVADGAWGKGVKIVAEKLRQELDLEHWPAFQASFRRMCDLLVEVGAGRRGAAPSTICLLSGDVHHAYLAEVGFLSGSGVQSSVWQAVCSPFRNPLDTKERRIILGAWTRGAGRTARALAKRAGVADPPVRWRLAHEKPWFNNQIAMLELEGKRATFVLEKAIPPEDGKGEPVLERVFARPIEPNADYTRT
ncbi:alkaline phosphatase family protein [Solirubrobacter ginsenosidimutans]|uniref:Alkaline phosphatase family protein n=1 Tax=Solirubrobacter ginsenosidimutans TaxID=490573 RepID=A0A9X3S222_9ACTN|nr:alkaline phosphatase D family protein [Solirubrobacter ginsenosidimutans]MDA0161747.1 alkaline phosphatase family protein [Solirubrobacter ginsenosidimutans]